MTTRRGFLGAVLALLFGWRAKHASGPFPLYPTATTYPIGATGRKYVATYRVDQNNAFEVHDRIIREQASDVVRELREDIDRYILDVHRAVMRARRRQ